MKFLVCHSCTFKQFNFLVDSTCEKCPEGNCNRSNDGKCVIYGDGYHCVLGNVGTPCNHGSDCFQHNDLQYYTWNANGNTANLDIDTCYPGN